jgi:hypothetical protein
MTIGTITSFEATAALIELDRYIYKRDKDLTNYNLVSEILEKSYSNIKDNFYLFLTEAYMPLYKAINRNSNKTIKNVSDLALEIKLLNSELKDVLVNPTAGRSEMIGSFLIDFSRELMAKEFDMSRRNRSCY